MFFSYFCALKVTTLLPLSAQNFPVGIARLASLADFNPLSSFLYFKGIIPFPHSDRAFTPIETVSYACMGLSLSCVFPISFTLGDYPFISIRSSTLFGGYSLTHLLTLDIWCFDLFELFTYSLITLDI